MIPAVTTCNTCRAAFPSTDKLKDHYRGEWHAFNSKRRASELAPLSLKEFAVYVSSKTKEGKGSVVSKPQAAAKTTASRTEKAVARQASMAKSITNVGAQESHFVATATDPIDRSQEDIVDASNDEEEDAWTDASGEEGDQFEEEMDEAALLKRRIAAHISIFDDKVCPDPVACVNYMERTFGFFIPDVECLTDLPGLLLYLGQKVKLGGICLYCQKQFEPGRACQNHMMNKSHCKIAYEEGVDLEEYEDYFDYDLASGSANDDDAELEVSDIGELIMSNKTVGHRSYRRYYKQNFKKEDSRPSILAVRREEVARLGAMYGASVSKMDEQSLIKLSDTAVAGVLAQQRREVLKETKKQQRAEQRFLFRTQKIAEYNSTVDKLRSHQTTTDKIRDYHSVLK